METLSANTPQGTQAANTATAAASCTRTCSRIYAVYFSPTLTTKKVVESIASAAGASLEVPVTGIDITARAEREHTLEFGPEDAVVFGTPVYIGRVPNLIAPYFRTIKGGGAAVAAVAVYGNRASDEALPELMDILEDDGFRLAAAAAFIGEHSFSRILAAGRPDSLDTEAAASMGKALALVLGGESPSAAMKAGKFGDMAQIAGRRKAERRFYPATDSQGNRIDIRKVKPVTDPRRCTGCGYCATVCPMGAIDPHDCASVPGTCIKCSACVKRCPAQAKSFIDPTFLSHLRLLEEKFQAVRREPEIFF